jgi:hypothetical protein
MRKGEEKMERRTFRAALGFLLICGLASVISADVDGAEPASSSEPKLERRAKTVDFVGQLGLPLSNLVSIGERIDKARFEPDPVILAATAHELRAAEVASGKHADLTAEAIEKEAFELAKVRFRPGELKTVAFLLQDEGRAKELKQLAERAEKYEKEFHAKLGARSRGVGALTVVNRSLGPTIVVYYNGNQLGTVGLGETRSFNVGDSGPFGSPTWTLSARNMTGLPVTWSTGGTGDRPTATWILYSLGRHDLN